MDIAQQALGYVFASGKLFHLTAAPQHHLRLALVMFDPSLSIELMLDSVEDFLKMFSNLVLGFLGAVNHYQRDLLLQLDNAHVLLLYLSDQPPKYKQNY